MGLFRKLTDLFSGRRARRAPPRTRRDGATDAPPTLPTVDKDEQVEALLSGRAQELVSRLCGDPWPDGAYEAVFTVSRRDLADYVARKGVPSEAYVGADEAGLDGWMHCVPEEDGWHVYWLERGSKDAERVFESEEQALQALAYEVLRRSGTGIVARWERG